MMKFDKNESAGFLINSAARLFAQNLQKQIEPLGIVTGQFPILLELWEGDGITQRELLEKLIIEQATLANTLTRMERDGLIKRTRHPQDARAQQIWLLPKAVEIRESAYAAAINVNQSSLGHLDEAEQRLLLDLLQKIVGYCRP